MSSPDPVEGAGAAAPVDRGVRTLLQAGLSLPCVLLAPGALAQTAARPAAGQVAVVFPDIGEPFRKVFTEIISGIEAQLNGRVLGFPVGASQDPAELAAAVKRGGARVVVALGRQGIRAAGSLDPASTLIVSGVSSVPDGERHYGVCLTPDPALLFAQLKSLVPAARRVVTVYNPQNNDWLVKLARDAARAASLELLALEARDLASAARQFESAFAGADAKRDAVWLPIDPTTVDEGTILPIVLREAWNRNVALFSSSFLHVKRGALFALYPNNPELGKNLGNLAIALLSGEPPARGVTPLRDVHAALNLRTASHIGLAIPVRVQRGFNFLYPEP